MLEGKTVNLRIVEREDLPLLAEWSNSLEFGGEFEPIQQISKTELEKDYDKLTAEKKWFIIQRKDGSKIGFVAYFPSGGAPTLGYSLIPRERRKGYCTEAVEIIVDYLFLSRNIVRVQAYTNPRNVASQKVLEKAGFKKEGLVRKNLFVRGKWEDGLLYGIIREEWKEPKILGRPTS